jgi:hypothetical protein
LKRRTALVSFCIGLALLGGAAWYLWPSPPPPPDWAGDYDVTARPPETIPPGTVVGDSPPEGWTHLVVKSLPRVRPGDESKIPRIARSQTIGMSRWMFTAFVADVRPETHGRETRHHLRAVALGLGTSVGGRDVVITPDTAERFGVHLDWITRTILTKGYQTQDLAVVVVHGPTFGLVDTPVWFHCGDRNKLVRFRYALLVDSKSGRLDTIAWVLDPDGKCGDAATVVLLNPNQINPAELIPDPDGFNSIGIASDSAFGVDCLPPHRVRLTMPPGLRAPGAKTRFAPDEARALEAGLRQLLATAP